MKKFTYLLLFLLVNTAFLDAFGQSANNTVGDFVWRDLNCDGIQQSGEPGLGGVRVTITYPNGTTTATTTTNSNGYYSFSNLPAGNYIFTFTTPSGYTPSPSDKAADITKDSDPVNGKVSVTVYNNENNPCIDAGFCGPTNTGNNVVGNFVWNDLNCDGIQQAGEPGIGGVLVTATYPDGVTKKTTTTNSSGNYSFTNLPAGNYVFSFTTPSGYTASPADRGNDITKDSDPINGKVNVVVYANEDNPCIDAGFCAPTNYNNVIGNFVWKDLDCDGIQDTNEVGIAGVQVTLTYPNGTTVSTITNSQGFYSFTNIPPGAGYVVTFVTPNGYTPSPADRGSDITRDSDAVNGKVTITVYANENNPCIDAGFCVPTNYNNTLGDFVWRDLNCDGIQQAGEPGIAGVLVTLTFPNGTTTLTTTTNASGIYQFSNLAPGNYVVSFTTPSGYTPSPSDRGGDIFKDSDPVNGKVSVIVYANEANPCIDAGFCAPVNYNNVVGDFVWRDLNCDGLQQAGEPGIAGVKVIITYPNGVTKDSTVTNASGFYQFTNLAPGNYLFTFITPAGYTPAPADQGTDVTKDSDAVNGSVVVTVYANENNPCIDAGYCPQVPNASIGDFVWKDLDRDGIQDAGEPGFPGVVVTLTGPNGTSTTTTNASGMYQFSNLPSGTYTVCFRTPFPFAYLPSPANQGGNDAIDSDPVGGCVTVVLTAGQTNNTVDAGFYDDIDDDDDGITDLDESGGIDPFLDCDGDGTPNYTDMTPGCPGLTWSDCPSMNGVGDGINDFFDFDRDGVINSLDLDSDNDGILDLQETRDPRAVDANHDGMVDGTDVDGDGLMSSADGTPNVYGGPGLTPQDLDRDGLPNYLDLDSDGDGITDLTEATGAFDDNGIVDGPDTDGDGVRDAADGIVGRGAMGIGLLDEDHDGIPNPYDIDSDDDGITDNIEGQPTCSYAQPTGQDTDKDGVDNAYDLNLNTCPPVAAGIRPYDKDGDGTPDIYDLDTDNDLAPDVNEGSGIPGNFVTQTGDADGDGLIDQFDIFNIKTATSIYWHNVVHSEMGPNGNFDGPTPAGSNATLPKSQDGGCAENVDRDWRNVQLLPVTLLQFNGTLDNGVVRLGWVVANEINMENYVVERSVDGATFKEVGRVKANGNSATSNYSLLDKVADLSATTVYYRLVQVEKGGRSKNSNVITFKLQNRLVKGLGVHPNPAKSFFVVRVNAGKDGNATMRLMDVAGRIVMQQTSKVTTGSNAITINNISNIGAGTYNLQVILNGEVMNERVVIVN